MTTSSYLFSSATVIFQASMKQEAGRPRTATFPHQTLGGARGASQPVEDGVDVVRDDEFARFRAQE